MFVNALHRAAFLRTLIASLLADDVYIRTHIIYTCIIHLLKFGYFNHSIPSPFALFLFCFNF